MSKYLLIALLLASPWSIAQEATVAGGVASEAAASGEEVVQTQEEKAETLYQQGLSTARRGDFIGGIALLKQAGELGHIDAQLIAASMLIDGTFYDEALVLMDQAVASGHPRARLEMAKLVFAESETIERPLERGKALLDTLVEEQYPPAMMVRAGLAAQGKVYDKDVDLALSLYREAADLGYVPAMRVLQDIYALGQLGQAVDLDESNRWKAAQSQTAQ